MDQSGIEAAFASLEDPRREQGRLHKLIDIITIAICAVISGAETWVDIVDFGEDKAEWVSGFLDLPNGIPSHDTFGRVFQLLDPQQVQACYQTWIRSVKTRVEADVVAVDGKTMRRSHDKYQGKSAVHMLHAWSVEAGLVLGQRVVGEKTNEIPEIPELLNLLYLKGCIVTLDAMGCQTEIVQTIVEHHEADYVIALKENQGSLYSYAEAMFAYADAHHPRLIGAHSRTEQIEKPRGQVERRICLVLHDTEVLGDFREQQGWAGLKTIARVQYAQREGDQWRTTLTRYFISSLPNDAHQLLRTIRSHWHIENKLHRVLDVTFRQDDARIRVGHSPENFAVLQHIALALLKQHPKRISLRRKRLQSARNDDLRWQILNSFNP
jgi:predicted transposase YbfD/YdcC